ncbi:hypothetical protein [Arthrobacter sp. ISL-65]|nr:hypothetical protein [Arthrobacter sp. ISL-65]MBT2548043.1 hypothetical protein [Arthrobacter sp. ISL-65]
MTRILPARVAAWSHWVSLASAGFQLLGVHQVPVDVQADQALPSHGAADA